MENEKERFEKINMAGIIGILGNIAALAIRDRWVVRLGRRNMPT